MIVKSTDTWVRFILKDSENISKNIPLRLPDRTNLAKLRKKIVYAQLRGLSRSNFSGPDRSNDKNFGPCLAWTEREIGIPARPDPETKYKISARSFIFPISASTA